MTHIGKFIPTSNNYHQVMKRNGFEKNLLSLTSYHGV